MSTFKKILIGIAATVAIFIVAVLGYKTVCDRTYFNDYDPNLPLHATVAESEARPDYQRIKLYFESRPGEQVPTLLTFPLQMKGKVPCIVFLHGIGQNKGILDNICAPFNKAGFAMATFDQYMQGERKIQGALNSAVAFRQRPWKTVNDTRRLIDYLSTHPDIDPDRIYLVGASYGAITGSTVTAFDKRIRAAVLIYGGGDIAKLLSAPMIADEVTKRHIPLGLLQGLGRFLLGPSDPVQYVAQIAPRPILFQNGSGDRLVCPAAAKALQEAAQDPKEVIWYDSDHLSMNGERDKVLIPKVLEDALQWLQKQEAASGKTKQALLKPAA
jgi:dienelactone hydrolase